MSLHVFSTLCTSSEILSNFCHHSVSFLHNNLHLNKKKIIVFVCNISIKSFLYNILVHKRQSLLRKYHTKPVYETVGKSSLPFFLAHCICTVSWIFFMKSPKPTRSSKIAGLLHSERESSKQAISS